MVKTQPKKSEKWIDIKTTSYEKGRHRKQPADVAVDGIKNEFFDGIQVHLSYLDIPLACSGVVD